LKQFTLILVCVGIFLIIGFTALKISPDEDTPVKYAKHFLNHLQDGDYPHAVASFGGNICRCPADLGWVSYLIYGSGEDPNLAFMMGKRFVRGGITFKKIESAVDKSKLTLTERPQDFEVDVPLSFDPAIYAPYFLPLDMAYGLPIKVTDFDSFLAYPDKDSWKALTLRMRPSLAAGTVAIPADAKAQIDHYIKDKKDREKEKQAQEEKGNKNAGQSDNQSPGNEKSATEIAPAEIAAGLAKEALASSAENKYLVPKDAGAVIGDDGKALPQESVANRLPRLKAATLRMHMVRRDPVQPFTVFHFVISDPVLLVPEKQGYRQVVLNNFKPPMPGQLTPAPTKAPAH
jgi:hypothetical protein